MNIGKGSLNKHFVAEMESLNLRTLSNSNHAFLNAPQFSYLHGYPQKRKPTFIHIFPQTPLPTSILLHLRPIQTTCCSLHSPSTSSNTDTISDANSSIPSGKRFIRNAALIGVGTLTSKILGLIREVILAAVFGVGPVATAFKYASVLPGFTAALIGGVNGPIHITMATTLSKLSKERQRKLFQHTNCIMFLVGGALAALVFVSAEFIIHIYAPGLWILAEGRMTREIAVAQLRTMIPCIVLAGPVGLGFGFMSAEGNNLLPSFSPALSSMLIIASCVLYSCIGNSNALRPGGAFVACGASLGAFLQWIMQVIVLGRRRYDMVPVTWITILKDKDVHEFFSLLLPATISSSLAQVASFTDLCLASLIPGAAAALSYAYLLAMAPVGLLSSIVILPLLPTFSRLSKTASWSLLVDNLKRVILLCMVVLLLILAIMCVLAEPIIRVLFERYMFDSTATALVSSLFLFYSLGSPFYIVRELLVMVFYSLGDAQQPFVVSVGAIVLNAILDCLVVSNLGAQGLALSTSFTTALSVLVLFHLLQKKLPGVVDYAALIYPFLLLSFCCISCGFTSSITYKLIRGGRFSPVFIIRIQELVSIALASTTGIVGFFFPVMLLHFSGFEFVRDLFRILMSQG